MDQPEPEAISEHARTTAQQLVLAAGAVRRALATGRAWDLEPAACEVLVVLFAQGPSSVTDVADRLGVDRTTVSHALALLDSAGLTASAPASADRRQRIRGLSEAGARVAAAIIDAWRQSPPTTAAAD